MNNWYLIWKHSNSYTFSSKCLLVNIMVWLKLHDPLGLALHLQLKLWCTITKTSSAKFAKSNKSFPIFNCSYLDSTEKGRQPVYIWKCYFQGHLMVLVLKLCTPYKTPRAYVYRKQWDKVTKLSIDSTFFSPYIKLCFRASHIASGAASVKQKLNRQGLHKSLYTPEKVGYSVNITWQE